MILLDRLESLSTNDIGSIIKGSLGVMISEELQETLSLLNIEVETQYEEKDVIKEGYKVIVSGYLEKEQFEVIHIISKTSGMVVLSEDNEVFYKFIKKTYIDILEKIKRDLDIESINGAFNIFNNLKIFDLDDNLELLIYGALKIAMYQDLKKEDLKLEILDYEDGIDINFSSKEEKTYKYIIDRLEINDIKDNIRRGSYLKLLLVNLDIINKVLGDIKDVEKQKYESELIDDTQINNIKTGFFNGISIKELSKKEFLIFVVGPVLVGIFLLMVIGYGFYSLFYLLHLLGGFLKSI